jgi:outer membrane protein insertion porin family
VSQANVFGSGKFISAQVNTGKVNATYALSYLDPYFTVDGISQGFDAYYRTTDASSLSIGSYTTKSLGGGIKFGYPLSERDSINFGLNAENVKLETNPNSPVAYINFVNQFGNSYSYAAATAGWVRDTRDSALIPTRGHTAKAAIEVAGGDLQYYRGSLAGQWFYPLSRTFTLAIGGDFGYVNGTGGKPVPFFKNFYAGGPGSVRGYESFSLGPQDAVGNVLGGTRKLVGSAEVHFPMPGAGADRSLRLSAFLDAGQVYGENEKFSVSDLRYSMGVGLSWISPFGPLRLSLAQPLNDKAGIDRIERLQFTFGSAF